MMVQAKKEKIKKTSVFEIHQLFEFGLSKHSSRKRSFVHEMETNVLYLFINIAFITNLLFILNSLLH